MKENIPRLRFPGFTEAWEQRKLGDLAEIKDSARIPNEEWCEAGVPYIRASDISNEDISGILFISYERYSYYKNKTGAPSKGDVLFNGGGEIGKTLLNDTDKPIYVQGGAVLYARTSVSEDLEGQYLKTYFETPMAQHYFDTASAGGTMKHFTLKPSQDMPIWHPKMDEQEVIGVFFNNIDDLITLHQRKLDQMKQVKAAMLQKMFLREGEDVPEVRFQGFSDAWEQRKFGELYEVNNERNKELIGYDKTFSIATMTYKDEGNGAADSSLANYKVLRIGDVAFEGHTNKEFRYGRFVVNDVGDGIMSPRFTTLRPIEEMPVSFWKYYIHYEPVMRNKLVCSTKAGTMMNELVTKDFFEQEIMVPSFAEQAKIGQYLENLDNLITLYQRKIDQMKEYKKGLLQQMFV